MDKNRLSGSNLAQNTNRLPGGVLKMHRARYNLFDAMNQYLILMTVDPKHRRCDFVGNPGYWLGLCYSHYHRPADYPRIHVKIYT